MFYNVVTDKEFSKITSNQIGIIINKKLWGNKKLTYINSQSF
jgi:hypothetical protein